jgi:hypothetical protein
MIPDVADHTMHLICPYCNKDKVKPIMLPEETTENVQVIVPPSLEGQFKGNYTPLGTRGQQRAIALKVSFWKKVKIP